MTQRILNLRPAEVMFIAVLLCAACRADTRYYGIERGMASWYGHPYHGRKTASGEIYDMEQLTSAHRLLSFGSMVRVTNLSNEKSVDVRINDRGPFVKGRIIDLSHAAAQRLGIDGVTEVSLQVLSVPRTRAISRFAVQVGLFLSQDDAERTRELMAQEYGTAIVIERDGSPSEWRVIVGSEPSVAAAEALRERMRAALYDLFVVALDENQK